MKACRFRVSQTLVSSNHLYPLLENLIDLNPQTGKDNVAMKCDPKYIFNRRCSLEIYAYKMLAIYQVLRLSYGTARRGGISVDSSAKRPKCG